MMRQALPFWKDVAARGFGGAGAVRRVQSSVDFMRERLDRPLPVAELAVRAGVSPSHFFSLFKRSTGLSPLNYFTRLRMSRACDLLDAWDLSVKEVAGQLGYEDPFYFSRVFKAVCGVSPSDYRELPDGEKWRARRRGLDESRGVNGRSPDAPPLHLLAVPRTLPARRLPQSNPQPQTLTTSPASVCAA